MRFLSINMGFVDYGVVAIGYFRDITIRMVNVPVDGDTEHITGTVGLSGSTDGFSIGSGGGAFDLAPGAINDIKIRFQPISKKLYVCNLVVTHNADYPTINPIYITQLGSGSDLSIRIGVKIETPSGFFFRTSDKEVITAADISFESGILTYPDLRVKSFIVYVQNTATGYGFLKKEFEAKYSERCNFSYAIIHASGSHLDIDTMTETALEYELNNLNQLDYGDPNSVLVSETYSPRSLLGANANSIGNSADDGILTFGVNAQQISAGQFGQFPLFAFAKRSIWLITVGDTVKFDRVIPFSMNDEILGKNAVLAYKSVLFFLTKRGLIAYSEGKMENLSDPLQDQKGNSPFLASLTSASCLSYFKDDETGREEIWVGTRFGTWVYSLSYGRWYFLDIARDGFTNIFGKTIGYSETAGEFYHENSGEQVAGSFRTAPIHLDTPELLKRFKKVWYTKNENELVSVPAQTVRSLVVNETIDEDVVDMSEINIEYEYRYPHRTGENANGGES